MQIVIGFIGLTLLSLFGVRAPYRRPVPRGKTRFGASSVLALLGDRESPELQIHAPRAGRGRALPVALEHGPDLGPERLELACRELQRRRTGLRRLDP